MSFVKKISIGSLVLLSLVSLSATAATYDETYFEKIATSFSKIIGILLPAFIGLAIIGFAWGLFLYVKGGADDKDKGKNIMIWGALAVVILLSIYGITNLFQSITGSSGTITNAPTSLPGSTPPPFVSDD